MIDRDFESRSAAHARERAFARAVETHAVRGCVWWWLGHLPFALTHADCIRMQWARLAPRGRA